MQDPQSLHKYAYVHGDPIGGIDPTGMVLGGLAGVVMSSFNGIKADVVAAGAAVKTLVAAKSIAEVWAGISALAVAVNSIHDTLTVAFTAFDFLQIDPAEIAELGNKIRASIDFTSVTGAVGIEMPNPVKVDLPVKLRGKLGALFKMADGVTLGKASEVLGELRAAAFARALGLESKDVPVGYHGFDGVFYEPHSKRYAILEAKGNTSTLEKRGSGWQMRDDWINSRIKKMGRKGIGSDLDNFVDANLAVQAGTKKMWAMVVKTTVDKDNTVDFYFRVRSYSGMSELPLDSWKHPLE